VEIFKLVKPKSNFPAEPEGGERYLNKIRPSSYSLRSQRIKFKEIRISEGRINNSYAKCKKKNARKYEKDCVKQDWEDSGKVKKSYSSWRGGDEHKREKSSFSRKGKGKVLCERGLGVNLKILGIPTFKGHESIRGKMQQEGM